MDLIKKSARTASARLQFCRHGLRRRRLGRRPDRYRRRREDGARLHRGRQDQAHLEPAARAAAEEPRQAAAQHADDRRPDDPARRHADGRSGRRGRDASGFRITAAGINARIPQAVPALLDGHVRERQRSTPMPSSRSIPACWRAPAASRSRSRPRARRVVVDRERDWPSDMPCCTPRSRSRRRRSIALARFDAICRVPSRRWSAEPAPGARKSG